MTVKFPPDRWRIGLPIQSANSVGNARKSVLARTIVGEEFVPAVDRQHLRTLHILLGASTRSVQT
jgi:hypothetical protein